MMNSPGIGDGAGESSSSVRSLIGDSKKEAVQVYVRVRPPFTHEVDDEQ
jgi:hypothetical protein